MKRPFRSPRGDFTHFTLSHTEPATASFFKRPSINKTCAKTRHVYTHGKMRDDWRAREMPNAIQGIVQNAVVVVLSEFTEFKSLESPTTTANIIPSFVCCVSEFGTSA